MNVQPPGPSASMLPPTSPAPSTVPSPRPADMDGANAHGAGLAQGDIQASGARAAPPAGVQALTPQRAPGTDEPGAKTASPGQVEKAVEDVQRFVETMTNNLQFSIDDDSGRTVVKVVDRQTEEVLRQIPSEEMLDIARTLGKLKGLLVEQKV